MKIATNTINPTPPTPPAGDTIVGTYSERDTAAIMAEHPHLLIIHTYKYDDLSPEAQATAREWFQQAEAEAGETLHPDMFIDDVRMLWEEDFGIDGEISIHWSLGHCQGDGVAFEGTVNGDALLKKHSYLAETVAAMFNHPDFDLTIKVKDTGRCSHAYSMDVEVCIDAEFEGMGEPPTPGEIEIICEGDLAEAIKLIIEKASHAAEAFGYKEITYRSSDEYLSEMVRDNEYKFTKDGHRSVTL